MENVEIDSARMLGGKLRFKILERDEFKCIYCGTTSNDSELHVDHIFPYSKGGKTDIWNLVTACSTCNMGKKAMELDENVGQEILSIVKERNQKKGYRGNSDLKCKSKRKVKQPREYLARTYNKQSDLLSVYCSLSKKQDRKVLSKMLLDRFTIDQRNIVHGVMYESEQAKTRRTVEDDMFFATTVDYESFKRYIPESDIGKMGRIRYFARGIESKTVSSKGLDISYKLIEIECNCVVSWDLKTVRCKVVGRNLKHVWSDFCEALGN